MPSSQVPQATERRNERMMTHEPPKLKTTLTTPPKQATNPLQFVKVGPCSLYRSAHEQLSKVDEVKKVKQEVREEAEEWQSNLDNWKSSRRKRQEHIIERVVEVKKLELEEHDRQRRRSKTFSEMMEERGSRGRKLSLAMYHEEDSNDLSDLGIGTSSGKSSISGDTHDDTQSVLSDRDSEIDKNNSFDNTIIENNNNTLSTTIIDDTQTETINDFNNDNEQREYDSGTTATISSPEPEEYTYENAIRGYVSRVPPNLPRHSIININTQLDSKKNGKINIFDDKNSSNNDDKTSIIKIDIHKRREIFEKPTKIINSNNSSSNRTTNDLTNSKSIKERLSFLEKQKYNNDEDDGEDEGEDEDDEDEDDENINKINRLSGDMNSIRERLTNLEIKTCERENNLLNNKNIDELLMEPVIPIRKCLSTLEKYTTSSDESTSSGVSSNICVNNITNDNEKKSIDKQMINFNNNNNINNDNLTPSERSSSPDSEYRASRTAFHRSLDSLDADASSGPDTFERVQSLEELDYVRRYPGSISSGELLNDTDREDSGIHTADVSCSVSQADEPIDDEHIDNNTQKIEQHYLYGIAETEITDTNDNYQDNKQDQQVDNDMQLAVINEDTAVTGIMSTNKSHLDYSYKSSSCHKTTNGRTVIYQSPRIPPRKNPPINDSIKLNDNKPSKIPTSTKNNNNSTTTTLLSTSTTSEKNNLQEIFNQKLTNKCTSIKIQDDDKQMDRKNVDNYCERRRTIIEESIVIGCGDKEVDETLVELPVEITSSVEQEEVPRVCELPVSSHTVESLISINMPIDISSTNNHDNIIDKICENEINHLNFNSPILQANIMNFNESLTSMSQQIPQYNMTSDEEIVTSLSFPLGPPSTIEPPKEKPPPPPTDFSDDENQQIEPLKRLNSTRRIKKELRTRRSDFLGIEGINDDDLEFSLAKPPNMASILAEERRIEQLHRRSYDTDSNYEQDSSHERDSGVELGQDWVKQPVSPDMSQHSRQSSEPFGASVTSSEEDEITKKEREIIEVLEKEEQWRYGNDREQNSCESILEHSDIGEKLAHKLRKLEEEKMQLERERAHETEMQHRQEEETMRMNDENTRIMENTEDMLREEEQQHQHQQQEITMQIQKIEEIKIRDEEQKLRIKNDQLRIHDEIIEQEKRSVDILRQEEIARSMEDQEKNILTAVQYNNDDDYATGEVLRVERELLQLEQEALKRQKTNLAYREQKQQQLAEQLQEQWASLQDVAHASPNNSNPTYQNISALNYRSSMPNLQLQDVQQQQQQRRRPPPPAKPLRLIDQLQRDATIRNSRIPSADNIPQQVDTCTLRHSVSVASIVNSGQQQQQQQMSKQTLQALSAVPRTRIVKSDQWVQRRKSDGPRVVQDFNYQHWLIQEAEQRRIAEKIHRSPVRKSQQHVTGTSVPYIATPTRSDGKPLPDSIIQTLTQRMQNRAQERPQIRRRLEHSVSQEHLPNAHHGPQHVAMMHQKINQSTNSSAIDSQEKMLSVSGKKKCSHCGDELGRGAAMIIESLRLFYHMECFKCCVCHIKLGDGLIGTDVRVRNHKLHCHNCYSSDDGVKFSCV
ncbi:putative mediator of RNA polymerase II transcription subunit 26 isoform X1 [Aphidius gifuensis]|uniref:putative mediator of RNA polymerase II transcription subunit 26 isoform X1 n=1 Tax=Aphidius gifuensis TaxID=684658 RepID=UPI001CDD3FD4|nr:putative mediator of RNA polymerase II transcription subunit 26 isoform X1 [Aphidius gifuensis]XP_044016228.1 putative mediator of RNA polymerase II transcription subunit 26 isoform X1 [Aphidius gifuensis]XP_044016229.1 putative mediator of RNA polymerase II transcription subunit 26 isoform X1 [Aphidius gifuensis]